MPSTTIQYGVISLLKAELIKKYEEERLKKAK